MKYIKGLLPLVVVAIFNGCATPYSNSGFTGGYSDTQLAPDVFRISFSGNGFTPSERAQDFALLHAADVTLSHGFHYFAIANSASGGSTSSISLPGSSYTRTTVTGYGNTAQASSYTTYTPPTDIPIFKPNVGLLIRCFAQRPAGGYVFDAAFLSGSLRGKYGLPVDQTVARLSARNLPPPPAALASQTRHLTLTDVRTGKTCYGGFNLGQMKGWVTLPGGTQLRGNLSAHSDATTSNPGTRSEGSALLVSRDSKKSMTVRVSSDGLAIHGTGKGVMNDGREFSIRW